jgi:hypothetical protein
VARFWFGLALLLAACDSPRIGEVGHQACTNDLDDDHDGLENCADPDCQNLDECRGFLIALDGGAFDGGRVPEGGIIGPPLLLDGGSGIPPHMDSGMSNEPPDEDSGVVIPIVDAGPPATCTPKCKDTEECIDLECKPVTASTSQTIAVTIQGARATPTGFFGECLDLECGVPIGLCCPLDSYVRVVQVHADGSPDEVIGRTATARSMSYQIEYTGAATFTVNLAQGDYLDFELFDENTDMDDRLLFDCKPDLTNLKSGPQTCRGLIGVTLAQITAYLEPKK